MKKKSSKRPPAEGRGPYAPRKKASELAQLRVEAGLTQAAAAAKLELASDSLGNIERGRAPASPRVLKEMVKLYGAPSRTILRAYRRGRQQPGYVAEGGPAWIAAAKALDEEIMSMPRPSLRKKHELAVSDLQRIIGMVKRGEIKRAETFALSLEPVWGQR